MIRILVLFAVMGCRLIRLIWSGKSYQTKLTGARSIRRELKWFRLSPGKVFAALPQHMAVSLRLTVAQAYSSGGYASIGTEAEA